MCKPRLRDLLLLDFDERAAFAAAQERRSFQPDHVEPKWPRDRVVDIEHIRIEIALDFSARKISGTATHRLSVIAAEVGVLEFDAAEIKVEEVRAGERKLRFDQDDDKLRIQLDPPLKPGEAAEVAIGYAARPRRGLYFVGPDEGYPNKPVEAWTQGEDEDSRYWFPCYDYPNDRVTSEVIATVPETFTAISNGELAGVTSNAAAHTRTFHWRHGVPHSAYLISLVAGEFVEIRDQAGSVPVLYYVHPGREDDARRAFGNTPRMIQFYERKIGVPYPYAKYAQAAVSDFIFGGMENTSATTQTADTLHDARAHLDFTSDPLVAHELAHQWWGDLLTCRDWSHAWLNEGFATYFEALWCEEDKGADEFAWNVRQDREGYLDEDSRHYRRAIVTNKYQNPIELFDRHLYEKGSLVLHMLRRLAGDELFFRSLNAYCTRHRGHNVITQDLQRAFEDTTGRNLDFFFDQWVCKEGHPEIEITSSFDDKQKLATVTVKQTHKVSDKTPLFRFPTTIALMDAAGKETRYAVEIRDKENAFHFPTETAPKAVRFDPAFDILKTLKHKRGREALELILKHAPEAIGRAEAARELGKEASPQAVAALREALRGDRFWGVRADAAAALGAIRSSDAKAALLEALTVEHPKARRAVVRALGEFRHDPDAAGALAEVIEKGDPSYFVEAEAAHALGKTRDRRAFEHLVRAMEKDSHLDIIRQSALGGLADLRDERGIDFARGWTHYGCPPRARAAALGTLGRFGRIAEPRRSEIIDFLAPMVDDREFMVRLRLPGVFAEIGDAQALTPLRRLQERDLDGRVKRRAQEAIDSILSGRSRIEEGNRMRDEMEKIREENRKLKERLEKLEASLLNASKA